MAQGCTGIGGDVQTRRWTEHRGAQQVLGGRLPGTASRLTDGGVPEDVAFLALYLASDESTFITGQIINAEGGMTAGNPTVGAVRKAGFSW